MGYYLRAFCTNPDLPRLRDIQTWLLDHGSAAVLERRTTLSIKLGPAIQSNQFSISTWLTGSKWPRVSR
jgi:hypothetical protein